jgi:hypothetical protein
MNQVVPCLLQNGDSTTTVSFCFHANPTHSNFLSPLDVTSSYGLPPPAKVLLHGANPFEKVFLSQEWCRTLVIPAVREGEVGGWWSEACPRQK